MPSILLRPLVEKGNDSKCLHNNGMSLFCNVCQDEFKVSTFFLGGYVKNFELHLVFPFSEMFNAALMQQKC